MQRRAFLQQFSVMAGACLFCAPEVNATAWRRNSGWHRYTATGVVYPGVRLPEEKRVPLGWKAFPVATTADEEAITLLHFPEITKNSAPIWLRLTAAIDFREELVIAVYLPGSRQELGQFDIKYAHPFQPFELPIAGRHLKEINRQGIALRLVKGQKAAWFFQPDKTQPDNLALQPHLLTGQTGNPMQDFRRNLLSMNSFSPFGWLGGNVQDALLEMARSGDTEARETLVKQLGMYLDNDAGIRFENTMTEPRDGTFSTIEDFLPFAAIVALYPEHKSVENALCFLESKKNEQGMIVSGNDISTEGCYTVAYPLAAIAVQLQDAQLAQTALNQLLFRKQLLTDAAAVYQRSSLDGHRGYANWGRGVVWYLLGIVKTLALLEPPFQELKGVAEMRQEFKRAIAAAGKWQNEDGMWYSFIDRPETGIDTSATAGMAAAIGWGVRTGLLDKTALNQSLKARKSLVSYLTPDGFLTQVSQINRGNEHLQANGYRVISQFGMGLLAQLEWVLEQQ